MHQASVKFENLEEKLIFYDMDPPPPALGGLYCLWVFLLGEVTEI